MGLFHQEPPLTQRIITASIVAHPHVLVSHILISMFAHANKKRYEKLRTNSSCVATFESLDNQAQACWCRHKTPRLRSGVW